MTLLQVFPKNRNTINKNLFEINKYIKRLIYFVHFHSYCFELEKEKKRR